MSTWLQPSSLTGWLGGTPHDTSDPRSPCCDALLVRGCIACETQNTCSECRTCRKCGPSFQDEGIREAEEKRDRERFRRHR